MDRDASITIYQRIGIWKFISSIVPSISTEYYKDWVMDVLRCTNS